MSGSPVPYALCVRPGESLLVCALPDPGGSRVPGRRYNDRSLRGTCTRRRR
ncbi:hypothetical protein BN2537_11401 [Streptomyces venezuelae]|nr:hypothetical protein BN2537_11401 [Streptomyces venezuelae]